jgi:hypothetical protein
MQAPSFGTAILPPATIATTLSSRGLRSLGGKSRSPPLSDRNLRGDRGGRANASRLVRRASGHGANPLSRFAPNAPRAARAPALGPITGDRHGYRDRLRLLGARAVFSRLSQAFRRVAIVHLAAAPGSAGSPSRSPLLARSHRSMGCVNQTSRGLLDRLATGPVQSE